MRPVLARLLAFVLVVAPVLPAAAQDGPARPGGRPLPPVSELGALFPSTVIYTNIPGDPTAAVPGLPGVEFGPGTGTTHFDRVYGSPNGNWILTADTDRPAGTDEVLIVNNVVEVIEGDPAPFAAGETIGFFETKVGINDAGEWVYATNTDGPTGADEYGLIDSGGTTTVAAQEGQAIPALPGTTWGSTIESLVIAADGTVGLSSDSIGGPPTTEDDILVLGTTLLGQEGVTVPPGQVGTEFWDNFDVSDYFVSADGMHWIAQGDLTGSTASDDVAVVDGAVVIQEDSVLSGSGFPNPVDGSGIVGVFMAPGGDWYARGNNDTSELDWVYGNGAVLTTTGSPIFTGSLESWSDAEFSDCFFLHVGNSQGDFVIGGVSDGPTLSNGVLVLNNTDEIVRESDPIDLDGNGMFDDDTFFDTFGNDDAHLTDAGLLYIVATIKDGTDTRIGQGFFVIDLSSVVGGGGVDLAVSKIESIDPVVAGSGAGNLVYTVTVANNGPDDATGVEVEEVLTLPAGVTEDSTVVSAGTYSAPTWSLGSLANGASETLTVTLTVDLSATPGVDVISDTATITAADQTLINTGDDSATEATSIEGRALIVATKSVTGDFTPGGSVVYTLELTNSGGLATADNPGDELVDVLPPELALVDAMVISGGGVLVGNPGTNTVTWNGGIPAGGVVTIQISATVVGGGSATVINQAQVAYDSDGDGTNDANTVSDDPALPGNDDPTVFVIAAVVQEIPTLSTIGLAALLALLALAGVAVMRRRRPGESS